jgi:hypothetical protein
MQVLESENDTSSNESDRLFAQGLVLSELGRVFLYETVSIASIGAFHDKVNVVNVLKSHDQGNDEFALKSGEDVFLEFGIF